MNHYAERGDWLAASQNAEVGLSDKSTCAEDRQKLAQLMVSYGLKSILAEKFVPQDMQGQLASVDRYRSIKRRAADLEVDFPSSLQIATDAYSVGQFPVAKAAFEDAYTEGAFNRADQTLLQNYSSTLYNIGAWWMQGDSNGEAYTIGSRMLVTSYYVDQTYGTGHGEAEALLKQKLGADKTTWPSPLDIPLPLDLKEMR